MNKIPPNHENMLIIFSYMLKISIYLLLKEVIWDYFAQYKKKCSVLSLQYTLLVVRKNTVGWYIAVKLRFASKDYVRFMMPYKCLEMRLFRKPLQLMIIDFNFLFRFLVGVTKFRHGTSPVGVEVNGGLEMSNSLVLVSWKEEKRLGDVKLKNLPSKRWRWFSIRLITFTANPRKIAKSFQDITWFGWYTNARDVTPCITIVAE